MVPYLIVFGASAGVAFLATPLVRLLALRTGAVDHPSDRKVHPRPTPTLGGLAMFLGLLAGLGASRLLPVFDELNRRSSEPLAALVAATAIVLVGAIDDLRGISPPAKVAGQVLAAGLMILAGVQLLWFVLPGLGVLALSPDLAVPLTVLWTLAIVNAVNLIDGLDGLAAGMVAIAATAFFVYMERSPSTFGAGSGAALLSAIAAGVAVGFLPWNFHPARIFMGDSGAMLLGVLLAVATISGVGRNPYPPTGGDVAVILIPLFVPLLVLAIPLLDVCFAIVRRVRRGRRITAPDKEHIHHRLLDIGHSHRGAVLLMYLWSVLISGSGLAVAFIDSRPLVAGTWGVAAAAFLATALPRFLGHQARRRQAGAGGNGPLAAPPDGSRGAAPPAPA
ncbi:MAG TPA: MraY family glycosyltransferase, partial [Actinomycetota bacterium]|nr:MraY family glycosyltransferase [Actinomycetota bacterium]